MNARYNGPSNCDSKTSLDSLVVGNNSANDREREFSTHNKLNIAPSFTNERQRGLLMTGNPPMDPRRPNGQGFSMNPMDPRQSNLVTSGNLSEPRRPNGHVSTGTLGFNIGPQASASRVPSVHENRNYSSNQPSSIMLNRTGSSTITQFTAALPTANGPIMWFLQFYVRVLPIFYFILFHYCEVWDFVFRCNLNDGVCSNIGICWILCIIA